MSFVRDYLSRSQQQSFTVSEVAMLLDVHANTVRNWANSGKMICQITLGGHRRISREVLERVGASCNAL